MQLEEFKKLLKDAGIEYYGIISKETMVFTELCIDSMLVMEMICELENRYSVEFQEEELNFDENLSVGKFLDIVNNKIADGC